MSSVSVALCTFDGARFVEQQLDSVVRQTRLPSEIVVSDDGSRDETRAVVDAFARKSSVPVRLLAAGPRRGVSANFERAIRATTTELVALSDQDDLWHPEHLERLAGRLDADDTLLLVHSDARLVAGDGTPLGATLFESLRLRKRELDDIAAGRALDVLVRRNVVTGATTVIRRSLLDLARPFPESWVHDEWLAMVAAAHGGVAVIKEQLLDYRQHGGNEIGARKLSPGALLGRLVGDSAERHARLATKWDELARRSSELGFDAEQQQVIAHKVDFERSRANEARGRIRRIAFVVPRMLRGEYTRFASQGNADVVRDLLSARAEKEPH